MADILPYFDGFPAILLNFLICVGTLAVLLFSYRRLMKNGESILKHNEDSLKESYEAKESLLKIEYDKKESLLERKIEDKEQQLNEFYNREKSLLQRTIDDKEQQLNEFYNREKSLLDRDYARMKEIFENQVKSLKLSLGENRIRMDQIENDNQLIREENNSLRKEIVRLEKVIEDLRSNVEEYYLKVDELSKQFSYVQPIVSELKILEDRINRLQNDFDKDSTLSYTELKEVRTELTNKISGLDDGIEHLHHMLDKLLPSRHINLPKGLVPAKARFANVRVNKNATPDLKGGVPQITKAVWYFNDDDKASTHDDDEASTHDDDEAYTHDDKK